MSDHLKDLIIEAPISEQFTVVAIDHQSKKPCFVFADSGLLETLEPLMENTAKNLKNFSACLNAVQKMVDAGETSNEVMLTYKLVLEMLIELREFDIRASELLVAQSK
jgi:glucose dehydrogenase